MLGQGSCSQDTADPAVYHTRNSNIPFCCRKTFFFPRRWRCFNILPFKSESKKFWIPKPHLAPRFPLPPYRNITDTWRCVSLLCTRQCSMCTRQSHCHNHLTHPSPQLHFVCVCERFWNLLLPSFKGTIQCCYTMTYTMPRTYLVTGRSQGFLIQD